MELRLHRCALSPTTDYRLPTTDSRLPTTDSRLQITHRINRRAVDPDLEMHVGAEAVAGAADGADHLALADVLADVDADRSLVAVTGRDAAAVLDAGVVPVAADPSGDRHGPAGGCADRRACRSRDVDARVEAPPA